MKFLEFAEQFRRGNQKIYGALKRIRLALENCGFDPDKVLTAVQEEKLINTELSKNLSPFYKRLDSSGTAEEAPLSFKEIKDKQTREAMLRFQTNLLVRFSDLSHHLIQTFSYTHQIQDALKLGMGGLLWQAAFEAGMTYNSKGGYIYNQCVFPGASAAFGITFTFWLTQVWMHKYRGDLSAISPDILIMLPQFMLSIPLPDALWQPVWDRVSHLTADDSASLVLRFFIALGVYQVPALLFSALQNIINFIWKQCGVNGFHSDAKFTAKVAATYTAFGATGYLSRLLQDVFGLPPVYANVLAASLTTTFSAGFFSIGQHYNTMDNLDRIEAKNAPLPPQSRATKAIHAVFAWPTTLIQLPAKGAYFAVSSIYKMFACCSSKRKRNEPVELKEPLILNSGLSSSASNGLGQV